MITVTGNVNAQINTSAETVTVPAGYAIIKDSPNTNDGMVISDVADDDLDNSKEGNQFVWIPVGSLDSNGTLDGEHFSEKFGRRNLHER